MSTVVGVGVDAIEIARVRQAVERTPQVVERLFTTGERIHCTAPTGQPRYGSLAVRFAAKEAVAKALGSGFYGFGFRDVEVVTDTAGKPEVVLHAAAAERAARVGARVLHLSLSRTRELAVAYATASS